MKTSLLETIHASALASAKRAGAQLADAHDAAQSAVLQAICSLSRGRDIPHPRAYGRAAVHRSLLSSNPKVSRAASDRAREVRFADGIGFAIEDRRVSA